jgi:hypothetical protein
MKGQTARNARRRRRANRVTDWTLFPSRKIDPQEIPLRRAARFTDRGGLYEQFERFDNGLGGLGGLGFGRHSSSGPLEECRGNGLVEFRDVVRWLVSAGIERSVVIVRFLLSARHGEFGRRGPQERIDRLFDLGGYSIFAPGQYPLRPSYITVEASPESMRARRSVWAKWVQDQGWPLPGWLPRSFLIEAEPVELSTACPSLAEPAPDARAPVEAKTPTAPGLRSETDQDYLRHVESYRAEHDKWPSREEDRKWGQEQTPTVGYSRINQLRLTNIPEDVRTGGRPPKNLLKKTCQK